MRTTINYTWEPDGVDVPVIYEFEITGHAVPYSKATRNEPASGGIVEDIQAKLVAIQDAEGNPVACAIDTAGMLTAEFQAKLDTDESLHKEVSEKLYDAAGVASSPDDEAYERARNRGWED